MLRLDTDFYESTLHELKHLYPRLTPGGVLIIDDYGSFYGARKAVDEYFAERDAPPLLARIDRDARLATRRCRRHARHVPPRARSTSRRRATRRSAMAAGILAGVQPDPRTLLRGLGTCVAAVPARLRTANRTIGMPVTPEGVGGAASRTARSSPRTPGSTSTRSPVTHR